VLGRIESELARLLFADKRVIEHLGETMRRGQLAHVMVKGALGKLRRDHRGR
jgi:hypothetical protein